MKILFNLEYYTTFGENLVVNILPENGSAKVTQHKMMSSDGSHWYCEVSKTMKPGTYIDYYYSVVRGENELRHEWMTIVWRWLHRRLYAILCTTTGWTSPRTVLCIVPLSRTASWRASVS